MDWRQGAKPVQEERSMNQSDDEAVMPRIGILYALVVA